MLTKLVTRLLVHAKNATGKGQSMKKFNKPPVGSSVTVTTRCKENYYYATDEWRDNTYTGEVLRDEKWFKDGDFKITSDEPDVISFRVINLNSVIDLKIDGQDGDQSEVDTSVKTVVVEGSNGNQYLVSVKDGVANSCTCKGFQYRKQCRHLKEAMGVDT